MTTRLMIRRATIVVACLLAIGGVTVIVRTAAVVRADAAPLVVAPVSAEQIAAEIDAQSSRAADLSTALAALETRTSDLDKGLLAAGDQMTMDAVTAAALRSDVAVAKARLASLQDQLAAAQKRLARLVAAANAVPAGSTTSTPAGGGHRESEEGDD